MPSKRGAPPAEEYVVKKARTEPSPIDDDDDRSPREYEGEPEYEGKEDDDDVHYIPTPPTCMVE